MVNMKPVHEIGDDTLKEKNSGLFLNVYDGDKLSYSSSGAVWKWLGLLPGIKSHMMDQCERYIQVHIQSSDRCSKRGYRHRSNSQNSARFGGSPQVRISLLEFELDAEDHLLRSTRSRSSTHAYI